MIRDALRTLVVLTESLVDPAAARQRWSHVTTATRASGLILVVIALAGAATLPRQISLLEVALAPRGEPLVDLHRRALRDGLLRMIVVDRVTPPPTPVLAGLVLLWVAAPALMLAEERRDAVVGIVVLGLAPLLVQRAGELAVVYLSSVPEPVAPGQVVDLPQRFVTGPLLGWTLLANDPAPSWLVALDRRVNLITLWATMIWVGGLRSLGDGRAPWHVGLPLLCLLIATLTTSLLAPTVYSLILGVP